MSIKSRAEGFTLVELVMFIVIVSIAVAGTLLVMNTVSKSSADPQMRKQALSIAEALLEEVSLARFTYCDPADLNAESAPSPAGCANPALIENAGRETGNARPFDNVNDYVGVTSAANHLYGVAVPIGLTNANNQPITVTGAYDATLTITPASLGPAGALISSDATPANTRALLITVTVKYGSQSIRLDTYRTRYAPNWMP